jgi:autotransporter-associated beta strand protein
MVREIRNRQSRIVLAAGVASVALISQAFAANDTWTGAAADGNYSNPANWLGSNVPGVNNGTFTSPDIATISRTPANPANVSATTIVADLITLDANRNIAGFTFNAIDTTAFTIGSSIGPALQLTGNGVTTVTSSITQSNINNAGFNFTIAAPMVVNGNNYSFVANNTQSNVGLLPRGPISFTGSGLSTVTLDGTSNPGSQGPSQVQGKLSDGASGPVGVIKNGTGTWEMSPGSGNFNDYSGDTVINAGTLRMRGTLDGTTGATLGIGTSANSNYIVNNTGLLRFSDDNATLLISANHIAKSITVNAGGNVNVSNSRIRVKVQNNSGPGLVYNYNLATANAIQNVTYLFTGTTPEQGGFKLTNGGTALLPVDMTSSTGTNTDLGTVLRPFDIAKGADANSYDFRIRGQIAGTGGLLKLGPGLLRIDNATNSLSGNLEVREGTLGVNSDNAFQGNLNLVMNGGTFRLTAGTLQQQTFASVVLKKGQIVRANQTQSLRAPTYTFDVASGDTASVAMVLSDGPSGAATVVKNGAGAGSITGANTFTGAITVNAGSLTVGDSARAPFLASTAGANVRGGRLVIDYAGGTSPQSAIVPVLTANAPTLFAAGLVRSTNATASRGLGWIDDTVNSKFIVAAVLNGDANLDGTVNFDDLLKLAANYNGSTKVWADGDFTYDGTVNFDDLLKLASNYNQTVSGLFAGDWALAQAVPEPTSLALLGAASVASLRRRRR